MEFKFGRRFLLFVALAFLLALGSPMIALSDGEFSPARSGPASPQVQEQVAKISREVGEIRGLPFKAPVKAEMQTPPDFEKYVEEEFKKQMPQARSQYFGKIATKLGLYRGPEIKDFESLYKLVMTSQAAAYYNPDTKTFYVLVGQLSDLMMGTVYSHELYHGLQDQYFDLNDYLVSKAGKTLDDDETLARQSVVEGEATFIMMLWTSKDMFGSKEPDLSVVDMIIGMQGQMDVKQLQELAKGESAKELGIEGLSQSVEALDKIPRFMIESMIGVYMKGMAFIREVQKQGWNKVAELYTTYPPTSSEQILHPEKWFAHENPTKIEFAKFDVTSALKDWELLDSNVLGEAQWRIVFEEFGMQDVAERASDGWDGDRYAVFKKKDSDDLLMLLYTCWDNEEAASEFFTNYRQLYTAKDPEHKMTSNIVKNGRDVIITEGGDKKDSGELLSFMDLTKKSKQP